MDLLHKGQIQRPVGSQTQPNKPPQAQAQTPPQATDGNGKLSIEDFTIRAITRLSAIQREKTGKNYQGIHVVYSGFNAVFKKYYGINAAVDTGRKDAQGFPIYEGPVVDLVNKGIITSRGSKGGPTLYLKGGNPYENKVQETLDTILS